MQHPLIFAAAFCFALPGVSLAADDPAEIVCHQRETTVDIMECLNGLTVQWDKRLNTVYQGALEASELGDRHTALAQAERAWRLRSGRTTAGGAVRRKARSVRSREHSAC